ncbi:unnamed protein product [Trichogramma brassicae]|uniref:Uncharacterized protein n=1 Tax=Trichogramma brassicae TaxID=86971 RepID=A0A6H5IZ80_9HYME|nr:unnamed protein product [Trichogramma brassicae]
MSTLFCTKSSTFSFTLNTTPYALLLVGNVRLTEAHEKWRSLLKEYREQADIKKCFEEGPEGFPWTPLWPYFEAMSFVETTNEEDTLSISSIENFPDVGEIFGLFGKDEDSLDSFPDFGALVAAPSSVDVVEPEVIDIDDDPVELEIIVLDDDDADIISMLAFALAFRSTQTNACATPKWPGIRASETSSNNRISVIFVREVTTQVSRPTPSHESGKNFPRFLICHLASPSRFFLASSMMSENSVGQRASTRSSDIGLHPLGYHLGAEGSVLFLVLALFLLNDALRWPTSALGVLAFGLHLAGILLNLGRRVIGEYFTLQEAAYSRGPTVYSGIRTTSGSGSTSPSEKSRMKFPPVGIEPAPSAQRWFSR